MKRWLVVVLGAIPAACALSQAPSAEMLERMARQRAATLAEPYVGITADGTTVPDLYSIDGPEGDSNAPLVRAANAFLDSLTREQADLATYEIEDVKWRDWTNVRSINRNGLGLYALTEGQREGALDMMRAALSIKGFATSRDIMRLNETLAEMSQDHERLDEWFYWVAIMGEPSETQPWGWQIEGHHLIINYFVLGNRVVMSPLFLGSEPAFAEGGVYQGTSVLTAEREKAFALYASLTPQQRESALLTHDEIVPAPRTINYTRTSTESLADNAVIPYQGLRADSLSEEQRIILLGVIEQFIGTDRDSYARIRMREIEAYLDETYFAWNQWDSSLGSEDLFFFRIHSPVLILEFDHQGAIALPGERRDIPIRQHLHAIVRSPNGNDYGKEWLSQHYALYPH